MSSRKLSISVEWLMLLFAMIVVSGEPVFGQAAARPNRGAMPTGSYSVSDIENVSLTNGNLNLGIALASLPPVAGGKLGLTLRAQYNSKLWDTVRTERQPDPLDPATKHVVSNLQMSDKGGWRIGARYSITFENILADYDFLPPNGNDPEYNLLTFNDWTKVVLTTPDGATHELRPIDYFAYGDGYLNHNYLRGYYKDTPNTTEASLRYYSFDGSHLWAKIDPNPYFQECSCRPYGEAESWTVYLPDGTKIEQASGIQRTTDNNGNKLKFFTSEVAGVPTGHLQDEQTGREIRITYDAAGNGGQGQGHIQYQTVGGDWKTIVINYGSTHVFGKSYPFGDLECPEAAYYVDTETTVIRSIVYPQTEPGQAGRQFTFTYNSDTTDTVNYQFWQDCWGNYQTVTTASHGWGSLSQIGMPTGATVNYAYTLDSVHSLLFNPDDAPRESLTTKTLIHDGTSDTWTYNVNPATGGFTAPDGSSIVETRYSSDPGFAHTYSGFGGKEELVYRTNSSNKVMVERHWTLMRFTGGDNIAAGAQVEVGFNPVVDAEYTSLLDDSPNHNPVKMSAKTYQYDFNGNIIQTTEYDWFDPGLVSRDAQGVPTGVPPDATVLRVTNNSYHNPATTSSSGNVYAKRSLSTATPRILNALQQTSTGPTITQLSYDGQGYGTAPTVGNLTSQSVWDDLDNKWITSSQTYDTFGNLITKTDPRGKVTQFYFDDATHALPNRVVVDPQNGTGNQTTTTTYDFSTGLVTSQTDPNGKTSTIDYTNQLLLNAFDPFGRPGIVTGPLGQRTRTLYEDSSRSVTVMSDLNTAGDGLLKSQILSDELGRTIESRQFETATGFISVRKSYDTPNRISRTSNPFRSGETILWTTAVTDLLGRVVSITTPDSAVVGTVYNSNTVTVTDQAGKARKSVTDALGRLTSVYEDPNGLNYLTSYDSDVFGNLLHVYQDSQTRTFTYDSLSRLRTASNPESGMVSYTYDDNGNLARKTDARGIHIDYVYDALNRATSRSYSDGTPTVSYNYDSTSVANGKGRLASVNSSVSTYSYSGYDPMGRVLGCSQTIGSQVYPISYSYSLGGQVKSMSYPSGHIVNYVYDNAGRLSSFTGNLGDGGASRNYATAMTYSPLGGMTEEKYGTTTPLYNKRHYNVRGQLFDNRVSTVSWTTDQWHWDRGAILNWYDSNFVYQNPNSGAGNNGNMVRSQTFASLPGGTYAYYTDDYAYDPLNRLQSVNEYHGTQGQGATLQFTQTYTYDRFGNRTINAAQTSSSVNNKQFTVNTANNRLGVPGGQGGTMTYDNAGNLTADTYSGAGLTRAYDGENQMTSETQANNFVASYSYDGDGRRVKRTTAVNGQPSSVVETWQIYGMDGELVAEYAANAAAASLQKEYGYRNGQLLITAEPGTSSSRVNVAAAANGGVAIASSTLPPGFAGPGTHLPPSGTTNGDRKGLNWGYGGGWADNTSGAFPDWLQIDFNGSKTIDEIDVFTLQNNYSSPSEPTETMTFNTWGLTTYDVQYWNGTTWVTVIGGNISGNNQVWRKITFLPITTTTIRVLTHAAIDNGYSRITEVEAWGMSAVAAPVNVAAAANGGVASASTTLPPGFGGPGTHLPPFGTINGDRKGLNWGYGGGWADNTSGAVPDWLRIDFNGSKTINEIDVFTLQNNYGSPAEPTETMTFNTWGLTAYEVQYLDGSTWVTVPGGNISGNDKVWRKITFAPIITTAIRVLTHAAIDNGYSRVTEVEAWSPSAGGGSATANINWLVADHLGTPRMIFDQSGSLAGVSRHDYLPFGEELFQGTGGRTMAEGYTNSDAVRQKFTLKERDNETGLDYFLARYYSSAQGRFTSYDPIFVTTKRLIDPQRLNLYSYARNNPLKFIDPNGADITITAKNEEEARKKFKTFQLGLKQEDRKHVQFFAGDGKSGYKKGQFYIKADKDYKSESGNFQGIQKAANDRTAVGRLTLVNPGDTITWRSTYYENRRAKLEVQSFKFEGEFDGYTVFQFRGKHEEISSAGRYTEAFIRGDQDEVELAATMHHELRAHILLGDFGRSVPRSRHSDPYARGQGPPTSEADKVGEAAEKEARKNAKRP